MGLRLEKRPLRGPARRPWKRSVRLRRDVNTSRGIWMRDMLARICMIVETKTGAVETRRKGIKNANNRCCEK